jgi:hypothetical protein
MTEWLAQPADGEFVVILVLVALAFFVGGALGR